MSKRRVRRKYLFTIKNINIDRINTKYGLIVQSNINKQDIYKPKNTTMITDLLENKPEPKVISFLDESKSKKTCTISMIDYKSKTNMLNNKHQYKCFWDCEFIPKDITPIGCPINYVTHEIVKTYFSEISQDNYKIKESISKNKKDKLKTIEDERLKLIENGFYETDGIFCSFNCCMAFIEDNYHNKLYNNSKQLLLKMYNKMCNEKINEIESAPHYRILSYFGGDLDINTYRNSFNKILYKNYGIVRPVELVSIGYAFEKTFKF